MIDRVTVREATPEDRIALWDWRNDPITGSLVKLEKSVSYRLHKSWFERVLTSDEVVLCIGLIEVLRIGCVRFDRVAELEFETRLFVKPLYCGRGYNQSLLDGACEHLRRVRDITSISAKVKKVNPASGEVFRRSGFSERDVGGVLLFERAY